MVIIYFSQDMSCIFIIMLIYKIRNIFYFLYLIKYNLMLIVFILILDLFILILSLLNLLHKDMINFVVALKMEICLLNHDYFLLLNYLNLNMHSILMISFEVRDVIYQKDSLVSVSHIYIYHLEIPSTS